MRLRRGRGWRAHVARDRFFLALGTRLDEAVSGARGPLIAALAFATHHLFAHGNMYVALFFVISGFCIHLPYAGAEPRKKEAWPFLVRRILRLYPAYLVAVLLGFAMAIGRGGGWGHEPAATFNLIGHLLFWPYGIDPLGKEAWYITPVVWSVIVELQLYLIYLLAWPILSGGRLRAMTIVMLIFGFVYHGVYEVAIQRGHAWPALFVPYTFAFARFGEWMLGAWIAEAYRRGSLAKSWLKTIYAPLAGIVGLVVGNVLLQRLSWDLHTPDALFSLSFACIVAWCVIYETSQADMLGRGWKFAAYVGHRSYSLYLCHFSILAIVGRNRGATSEVRRRE